MQKVKKPLLIVLTVIISVVAAFLVWRAMYSPPEVTDAEAREFLTKVDEIGLHDPGAACDEATFPSKCQEVVLDSEGSVLNAASNIVCTWPLSGSGGARVVEIENAQPDGTRFRTSVSVSRDGKTLTGWPMPYWVYPTRDVPEATTSSTDELPSDVDLGSGFDPCSSSQSSK